MLLGVSLRTVAAALERSKLSTFEDMAAQNCDPWRDPDPKKQKFELELSYRLRKFSARWKVASEAEKKSLLKEMAVVERETEKEFGLEKSEPQPQQSLAERIRLK